MKNTPYPFHITFSLGMILVLSACSLFSSDSIEEQMSVPEMAAPTPPPATEERLEGPPVPNPASIDISLEAGAAAATMIGPEGGSIKTMDAKGTEYTLTIPEGALFSDVEITMTPIASAEGEAIGDTFLAGVALEPENLHFLELVSIEIAGDVIEAGVKGFSSEAGGQDFHLTPSRFASGSLTITTSHFSEFGVSLQEVVNLVETLAPVAETAVVEHGLALGNDQQALAALKLRIRSLRNAGSIASFEAWEPWTADVMSLVLRFEEVKGSRGWDENTPGLTDTMRELQSLIDQWFQQSDGVIQALSEKCIQGEIEVMSRLALILKVGVWLDTRLSLDRDEVLRNWLSLFFSCNEIGITWQANVVTTGNDFFSDISVGSEAQLNVDTGYEPTTLDVEYIDGFWHDTCVGTPGVVTLGVGIDWEGSTDYYSAVDSISKITATVEIVEPVYIDCSQGTNLPADAQKAFHGGALEELNKGRVARDGYWTFEIEYDPGRGVIGQFEEGFGEEGPKKFSWSEGEYELMQLVSIYKTTSAE